MVHQEDISLSEVHQTVHVPLAAKSFVRRFIAFGGPAYLVSVGYIDPGNWATDLEGGSRFGYDLLWVLVLANGIAILLQTLSARLGIVTGRDLAQACREQYSKPVAVGLWILCEIAIAACDLAEVLGTAIALNLLFGIQLLYGVFITAADVLVVLGLRQIGMRKLEAIILSLVFIVGVSLLLEMFLAHPSTIGIVGGLVPKLNNASLFVAIGILGATVMPHNLYLHSALVQTRRYDQTLKGKLQACKYNFLDSLVALNAALFINGAILILAASVFFANHLVVTEIQQAHQLLTPLLGNSMGSFLFAIALLASGQSSTITGTLAGQVVMEGFVNLKIRPAMRRLLTRGLAIVPAALVIWYFGDNASYKLLLLSQVVLSMQLAFAIVPLIRFTSDRRLMGEFANGTMIRWLSWIVALFVVGINARLVYLQEVEALSGHGVARIIGVIGLPVMLGLVLFLSYLVFRQRKPITLSTDSVGTAHVETVSAFRRIGVAIEHSERDRAAIARARLLAQSAGADAEIILIHVSVSASSQILGSIAADRDSVRGEDYARQLESEIRTLSGIPARAVFGYGSAPREIVRIAKDQKLDILIMAAHGHRGIKDVVFGTTISAVRHSLNIPILVAQ